MSVVAAATVLATATTVAAIASKGQVATSAPVARATPAPLLESRPATPVATRPAARVAARPAAPAVARHPRVAVASPVATHPATTHPATTHPVAARPATVATTSAPVRRGAPTRTATRPTPTRAAAAPTLSAAAAALLAHLNPAGNIAPSPDYLSSGQCTQTGGGWSCTNPCVTASLGWPTVDNTVACTTYVLAAINHARGLEGVAPMVLPSNWYQLSAPEQLFVVADLERTARGLTPYLGINASLTRAAQSAAQAQADPSPAAGFATATDAQGYPAVDGTWATGFSVLAADYAWMYNDGWGGSANNTSNADCASATSAGCWSHRDELLGYAPGFNPGVGLDSANAEMGVGVAVVNGSGSFVDLIEAPSGAAPAMTFTWAQNVLPYL